ncbi:hypothetical protein [Paenibacillus sp. N3.4]|uniref:hypothetical protein n=1 Tax=Paenibacillus sp. N3.4 TaxID=2603222 RepID=UPI0011CB78E2|nr:hypothetical protein [Paenibacillus sp. N3.4]TXK76106.1 hypothetical protein FU659_26280 [Paenibacillus sp. N3.4]
MDLAITDNYGITYKKDEIQSYNFALGTLFLINEVVGDPANGAVGTVSVNSAGIVKVTGNVKSFELTAATPGSEKVTSYVNVKQ